MKKQHINWKTFTSEEISLKKLELKNTYEMLYKMSNELLGQMEKIEYEFEQAENELKQRKII